MDLMFCLSAYNNPDMFCSLDPAHLTLLMHILITSLPFHFDFLLDYAEWFYVEDHHMEMAYGLGQKQFVDPDS
jgi:hypothetical protein